MKLCSYCTTKEGHLVTSMHFQPLPCSFPPPPPPPPHTHTHPRLLGTGGLNEDEVPVGEAEGACHVLTCAVELAQQHSLHLWIGANCGEVTHAFGMTGGAGNELL